MQIFANRYLKQSSYSKFFWWDTVSLGLQGDKNIPAVSEDLLRIAWKYIKIALII